MNSLSLAALEVIHVLVWGHLIVTRALPLKWKIFWLFGTLIPCFGPLFYLLFSMRRSRSNKFKIVSSFWSRCFGDAAMPFLSITHRPKFQLRQIVTWVSLALCLSLIGLKWEQTEEAVAWLTDSCRRPLYFIQAGMPRSELLTRFDFIGPCGVHQLGDETLKVKGCYKNSDSMWVVDVSFARTSHTELPDDKISSVRGIRNMPTSYYCD